MSLKIGNLAARRVGRAVTLAATALLCVVCAAGSAAAEPLAWQPRPAPQIADLYAWEPVWPEQVERSVAPGESVEFEPERLAVLRVQFEPAQLEPYLEISQQFEDDAGEAKVRLDPVRLDEGDLLLMTEMHRRAPLRVRLSEDAPIGARLTVQRAQAAEPRFFWLWWSDQLYRWLHAGGEGAPPAGLPIPEQQDVLHGAQVAAALPELAELLGANDKERKAAMHLASLLLIRSVEQHRDPDFAYYRRSDLAGVMLDPPPRVRMQAGSRSLGTGYAVKRGQPVEIEVQGPRQIHLGVRAVKAGAQPDAITDYALRVSKGGEVLRHDAFSSRAAKYDAAAPVEDAVDASQDESAERAEDDDAPDETDEEATRGLTDLEPGKALAEDQRGNILGWRRQTRWWVPPGKHRYRLEVTGADAVLDGTLARPRNQLYDLLSRRWDANWHLAQVDRLLGTSTTAAARFLRVERTAALEERGELRRLIQRYGEDLSKAGGQGVWAWLEWRRLAALAPDAVDFELSSMERARAILSNTEIPRAVRRAFAFEMARRKLQLRQPNGARGLLRTLDLQRDTLDQVIVRVRAEIEAGDDPWERWQGVAQLFRTWQRRPTSDRLRRELQRAWWHKTYWRDLAPTEADARRVELMEPLASPTGELYLADLRSMSRVWYRVEPGAPYKFRPDVAPDLPDRLARVRMAFTGTQQPGWRSWTWDGRPMSVLRTDARQEIAFAARPGKTQTLALPAVPETADPAARGEVFIDQPPLDKMTLAETAATRERAYWRATDARPQIWKLQGTGTPRWIRVAVRGTGAELVDEIRCDFGTGKVKNVDVRWTPSEELGVHRPVEFVLRVPAAASQIKLEPEHNPVLLALEMRAGKLPDLDDDEQIDVEVKLPADQERLDQIRALSAKMQEASGVALAGLRIDRAMVLMSLARNKLARADLERVLEMLPVTHPLFEKARLLARSVSDRLSYDWLELRTKWLGESDVLPLDLPAQPVADADATLRACSDSLLELLTGAAPSTAEVLARKEVADEPACTRAALVFALGDARRREDHRAAVTYLRELVENWPADAPASFEARRQLVVELLLAAETHDAPTLTAEAYGHARAAASTLPVGPVRSAWYDALKATRWESITMLSGGVSQVFADFAPWLSPANLDQFDMPVLDDPVEEKVEFALLGVDWPREHAQPMYGDFRRTLRFRAPADGQVKLHRICVDHRPGLQDRDPAPPCRILGTLRRDDGTEVATAGSTGALGSQRPATTTWPVEAGVEYKLAVHRRDEVAGRLAYIYASHTPSGGEASPLVRRRTRRLMLVEPSAPAGVVVLGPTYLRVDARTLDALSADAVSIEATHVDSATGVEATLELSDEVHPGSSLDGRKLTRARRGEWWLPERGAYRIRLRPEGGPALLRVYARHADPERPGYEVEKDSPDAPDMSTEMAAAEAHSDSFDTDIARSTVAAPPIARFGRKSLLDQRGWSPTGRVSLQWQADDVELAREAGAPAAQSEDFLELNGAIFHGFDKPKLWLSGGGGVRSNLDAPPVLQARVEADWRPDFWRLRVQPELELYSQSRGQAFFAGRGEFRLGRSFTLTPDLFWIQTLRTTLRLQQDDAPRFADGPLSTRVHSDYAAEHVVTADALAMLWWRPLLDFVGYGYLQPTFNPDMSVDKLRARLVGRTLVDTTRAELGYRFTWYVADAAREEQFLRHDVDLLGRLYYWAERGHLLELEAFGQASIYDFYDYDQFRLTAGLQVSYTFTGGGGLEQLPPTALTFEELVAPRYFGD